jgi:hypothetical protein
MSNSLIAKLILIHLSVAALASPAIGGDAASNFSPLHNPAGPWSYGWAPSPDGPMTLFDESEEMWWAGGGVYRWRRLGTNSPLSIFHNGTDTPLTFTIDLPVHLEPGELAMKAAPGQDTSVLRWTAPDSGRYRIEARFESIVNVTFATSRIGVLHHSTQLLEHTLSGFQDSIDWMSMLDFQRGDTIDFTVTAVNGGYIVSETAVRAAVTPAPNGDLNGDGSVNGLDLGLLLGNWSTPAGAPGCAGKTPCSADLNNDGVVNGLDLGILLAGWTM